MKNGEITGIIFFNDVYNVFLPKINSSVTPKVRVPSFFSYLFEYLTHATHRKRREVLSDSQNKLKFLSTA